MPVVCRRSSGVEACGRGDREPPGRVRRDVAELVAGHNRPGVGAGAQRGPDRGQATQWPEQHSRRQQRDPGERRAPRGQARLHLPTPEIQSPDGQTGAQVRAPAQHRVVAGDQQRRGDPDRVGQEQAHRRVAGHAPGQRRAQQERQQRPRDGERQRQPDESAHRQPQQRQGEPEQGAVVDEDDRQPGRQRPEDQPDRRDHDGSRRYRGAQPGTGALLAVVSAGQQRQAHPGEHGEQRRRPAARHPVHQRDPAVRRGGREDVHRHHPEQGHPAGDVDAGQPLHADRLHA